MPPYPTSGTAPSSWWRRSRRALTSGLLLTLLGAGTACVEPSGPVIITYGVRLTGATADHGAVVLALRNLPANVTMTPAAGVVMHQRTSVDGTSFSVLLAGDLTRTPLLTFAIPRAPTLAGSVTELARQDGTLATGVLPTVTFTLQ